MLWLEKNYKHRLLDSRTSDKTVFLISVETVNQKVFIRKIKRLI